MFRSALFNIYIRNIIVNMLQLSQAICQHLPIYPLSIQHKMIQQQYTALLLYYYLYKFSDCFAQGTSSFKMFQVNALQRSYFCLELQSHWNCPLQQTRLLHYLLYRCSNQTQSQSLRERHASLIMTLYLTAGGWDRTYSNRVKYIFRF